MEVRYPFSRVGDFNEDMDWEVYWVVSFVDSSSRPFIKTHGKGMLTSALKTGMEVADDVFEGKSVK